MSRTADKIVWTSDCGNTRMVVTSSQAMEYHIDTRHTLAQRQPLGNVVHADAFLCTGFEQGSAAFRRRLFFERPYEGLSMA